MKNIYIISLLIIVISGCKQELEDDLSPWKYEQPQSLGANAVLLLKLDQEVQNNKFGNVNSIVIVKNDHVIFENYYNGFTRNDLHPLNRASQSVLTLMLESAFNDGNLSTSEKIVELLPEYDDIFFNIPQKDKIEIRHLLEQTSGFNWSEWNFSSLYANNKAEEMERSDDWVRFVLSTKMIREPGMEFNFNSGHSIVLSAILEKKLPETLDDYLKENLFDPLNITNYKWEKTPNEILNTASGLQLTATDMAKLGYLLLEKGNWKGRQIVSEQWVDSLNTTIANSDYYKVGINWFGFNAFHPVAQSLHVNDVVFTWGEGGQFIFTFPNLETVVVITASNYDNGLEFSLFYILRDYILPSLIGPVNTPTGFYN